MITNYSDEAVLAVDMHYIQERLAASHLLIRNSEVAIVDCGTSYSTRHILAAIQALDLDVRDVRYLILTHIHLDHAGGAGQLMAELPDAKLIVHPRGSRHMADPSKLWAGATSIYGDAAMKELYGSMIPIDASRIVETSDEDIFDLGQTRLQFLHTPGHAKHHHSIWEPATGAVFTGDTFGLAYPRYDTDHGPFIFPTTSPVHFDPEAMKASVRRFMALQPNAAFLGHYGRIRDVQRLGPVLIERIDRHVEVARRSEHLDAEEQLAAIKKDLWSDLFKLLQEHGVLIERTLSLDWWETDIELNAQGLQHWLTNQ